MLSCHNAIRKIAASTAGDTNFFGKLLCVIQQDNPHAALPRNGCTQHACRTCADTVAQAPAPAHLIEGAMPTEALIAHVLTAKYGDHCPLYRQAQIYQRSGVELDRSTLADWVGGAAALFAARPEPALFAAGFVAIAIGQALRLWATGLPSTA